MKKYSLLLIASAILIPLISNADFGGGGGAGSAPANRHENSIRIMSGQTIIASGTSTFIIDLRSFRYYPIVEGDFSLQFKGFLFLLVSNSCTLDISTTPVRSIDGFGLEGAHPS